MTRPSRRRFLLGVGSTAGLAGFAGCGTTGRTDDRCADEPPEERNRNVEPTAAETQIDTRSGAGWPQPGHDSAGTRFSPDGTGPETAVRFHWSQTFGDGAQIVPVAGEGSIYVTDETGRPVVVDAETGSVVSRFDGPRTDSALVVSDGVIYLGNESGVHALDAITGERRWTFAPSGLPGETMEEGSSPEFRTPVLFGEVVYVAVEFGEESMVHALDRETGEERWRVEGSRVAAATSDAVFVYLFDAGDVIAIDAAGGSERWRRNVPGATSVSVSDGLLYTGSRVGEVVAHDVTTGERRWRFEGERELFATPSVAPETVYAATSPTEGIDGGNLYALDADSGTLRWCAYLGTESVGPPAVTSETVFVPRSEGLLQARSADDGALVWQFYERDADFRSAAVVGNALFVGTGFGRLYAFAEA